MTHIDEFMLQEYVDNALDDHERRVVTAHLDVCPSCQQQLAEVQHLFAAFATLEDEPLTTDLSARVISGLRVSLFGQRSGKLILAAQLLLIAAMVVVLWPLFHSIWQTTSQMIEMPVWQPPELFEWAELLDQLPAALEQVQELRPSLNLTTNQWYVLLAAGFVLWLGGNWLGFAGISHYFGNSRGYEETR